MSVPTPAELGTRDALVGTFVALGILFALGLLGLTIIEPGFARQEVRYRVRLDSGIGLRPGIPVTFSGMEVGEIESVGLTPNSRVEVTLLVGSEHAAHVRADCRGDAVYTLDGKVLDIAAGSPDAPPLEPGGLLQPGRNFDPILALQQTDLPVTLARIAGILEDIEAISSRLDLGEGEVPEAIDRLLALIEDLEAGRGSLGRLLRDDATVREAEAAMASVVTASDEFGRLAARLVETSAAIDTATAQIASMTETIGTAAGSLTAATTDIGRTAGNLDRALESLPPTLDRLNTSMDELTRTLRAIQKMPMLKGKVDRDPE